MITLAGGTGLVGKTLTQALVRDGEQVRVLTRDPNAAAAAFGDAKLEIVGVDFDDTATLRSAFTGSDKAFLSYGTSDRQVRDEIALIDAAINADVPYLVNLSVGGAGGTHPANVVRWHTEIDAYLASVGVASTVVRPTTFTDVMLKIASNFVRSGAWGGLGGAGRVALIDTRDVAEVFAVILTDDPHRHAGKTYDISGPAGVTMDEVAGYLSAAVGPASSITPGPKPSSAPCSNLLAYRHLWSMCWLGSMTSPEITSTRSPPPPFSISPATPHARSTTGCTSTSRCSPRPPHNTAG